MYMPYAGDTKILYHYTTEDLVRIYISPIKNLFSRISNLAAKSKSQRKWSLG